MSEFRARHAAGFTLIEVMLAITLVALIMAMAYGGFRASIRATTSGEQLIEETNRLRVTHQFVRTQLSQALALVIEDEDSEDEPVRFEGEQQRVRFVAPMPGYLSYGGPYVQQFSLERGNDGLDLVFSFAMLNGYLPGDLEDSDGVTLLEGLRGGGFFFLGMDEEDQTPFWADFWENPGDLPLAVGLNVDLDRDNGLAWPELVTPVRVDATAAAGRPQVQRASELMMRRREQRRPAEQR
ncbi:MAG: prepilin-type N-terminal cleavage/methylation domain-containing protein [Wenzhouxiangella sp.]|nr:MAG: prepilin-type N-terminal cleavage/methylation domain-containing protein [Wenzhouxiangella sp.]